MDNVENNILNDMENLETDGNTSFLRAARNGQLEKVLEHLKTNIDINTSNANGLNALHLASKDGHVDIVEELLKRGAIVDAATKKGNTALHIASLAGQEEVVKLLVHHGASVNVQSQNGFTPLYMAAQENHDNVVKFLLANGANQSLSTEDGFTPLAVAMQQGHDKVVTVLLENDTRGKVRLPALHIAAKKDDVRAAKLLLENDHNPDVTSKSGFTPLHIASHYGNQSIANLLIQKGADVNYSAKHNITPLHVAAKWGKSNMVALLLEQGAHIEAKTRDGLTPLHCAARSGHEQVVDMLLEKSAPISSKTKNGLAPLHMAAQGDHVDAARILLYHRAPVDEVTVDYLTALHVAAHCGHVRVAKLLLDRQADANARALNGFTPLHIACKKNRIKVVELLLKHGACIGATTESGLTPLHVASFMGCMNIVIYLLQHDASPDIPTVRGETPLHLAARANQTDIIRILLRNGAQVDARAREQQTPLHIASRLGNVDIVMLLLQHGAKVDNTTKDMYTALHIAAKEGQDEVAAVLIENGASLNATTKKGFTPLHLAAKYGHLKVAKLLVQKEAPVDAQGKNGVTPLHVASHYDHQNVALLLLDKGASPHANAKNGHTPLHIAARKNQMDIAHTLLEYGAEPDAESKAGFTPLHLSSQEGHADISALLLEHKASPSHQSKNGLTPMHLCAQENKVAVAEILHKNGADIDASTKGGYTPLHIASHYGQADMVKFLLSKGANVKTTTSIGYTPLHQAAQQGHTNIVNLLLENSAEPNAITNNGQTPLHIAQKLGYITVIDTLKEVTEPVQSSPISEEKYRVVAPEAMHETFLSDSEEEGEDTLLGDQTYRYLTADEMKSLGDDSLPIDVTRDERIDSNRMVGSDDVNAYPPRHIEDSISPEHIHPNYVEYIKKTPDNIDISRHPVNIGFLVSFLVDARGGAMRGCRHSGVRVIVPPRCAPSPTRITCRYVRPQRTPHPPPLMEGEALASRVLELGPVGAKFLGPVIIEVPHFAALRGKEREIVILRSDNGESWKEHTIEATEDVLNEVLRESFEADDLNQLEDTSSGRITRIITQDFPQYFAVISRIRQEVHAIGPEGGMVSSTVVPQVQAVFPQGALTKKIKVGLQAQPIDPELTAKLLGHGVAVSPVVTVEPRRRKFHKAITLSMPAPRAHSQGMINQYSGSAPTLRLLCSITGGTSRAQWEDVTGSTPLTFVNDCVSFTTTVSARFWLMDCRNIGDATKMATELYREAIHVPFIAKFVVFAKRIDPLEARLRVFCMTDDKEEKTLEYQEQFTEIAKSRDVEVLEGKSQYIEFAGNLIPITKSGEQLQFSFRAFRENRLPFSVRVKDQHAEAVSRCLFMREPKVQKGEPPQQPICILNIVLPDDIVSDTISLTDSESIRKKYYANENFDYYRQDPRLADMSNLLGDDWVSLANQLGLTSSEINVIKSEYPDSVAKQAQSMLRMWLSQSGNRTQANTLDNALRRIGREDIVNQCLNVDNRSQQILRLRTEEKESQRLRNDIADDASNQKRHYALSEQVYKPTDTFDKYSAEEKTFEPSDEEEDFNKTVPERREQIVKRLSTERTIPASSQRVEIVQEISSIKRQSLVEDKIAEVQQKVNIEPMKITNIKPVSKIIQEKKTLSEAPESKTTSPPEKAPEIVSYAQETDEKPRTTVPNLDGQEPSDRRDSVLLEEVTQLLEFKKPVPKLITNEEPKSPKFSKTPPPSPADFASKEKQASTAQEWEASEENHEDVSKTQPETVRKEIKDISCRQLTEASQTLSTNIHTPQPMPRQQKPKELFEHYQESDPHTKQISPVRDDLLDEKDQAEEISYQDKKKFWETISKEPEKNILENTLTNKRKSIHEISQPPIPKPRGGLLFSYSVSEISSEKLPVEENTETKAESHPETNELTCTESPKVFDEPIEVPKSEYQASFVSPLERGDKSIETNQTIPENEEILSSKSEAINLSQEDVKDAIETIESKEENIHAEMKKSDSTDSDTDGPGQNSSLGGDNAGYISDCGDVEQYISDSEIEDRVPQIRERQMSVFVPPSVSQRTRYERSASLPTEDLYEVSARSTKLRKQYYEEQIKKEMIKEQLTFDLEDENSPERKSIGSSTNIAEFLEKDSIYTKSSQDEANTETSIIEMEEEQSSFEVPAIPQTQQISYSASDEDIVNACKIDNESVFSIRDDAKTELDDFKDLTGNELSSKEIHVDKSEIEKSEKVKDKYLDGLQTSLEIKSISKSPIFEEAIPEITFSLSGKQRRISEESDEYAPKDEGFVTSPLLEQSEIESEVIDDIEHENENSKQVGEISSVYEEKYESEIKVGSSERETEPEISKKSSEKANNISLINQPEENVTNTVWEVSVESETVNEEKLTSLPSIPTATKRSSIGEQSDSLSEKLMEKEEDLSSDVRDESDLGSEIHQDHSDSSASDKIKSESHSDMKRIILESLHQQKVDPEEAKIIANSLIEEIESEIQKVENINRGIRSKSESTESEKHVTEYLKELAESKGLDQREVELVESVLERRQRQILKLTRGDTQASSMEITDEDLRHSEGDLDYRHILEQQMDQLEAEYSDNLKNVYESLVQDQDVVATKISEDRHKEDHQNIESQNMKKDIQMKVQESLTNEKSYKDTRNVIIEEDETLSESITEDVNQTNATFKLDLNESTKMENDQIIYSEDVKAVSDMNLKSDHQIITDKITRESAGLIEDNVKSAETFAESVEFKEAETVKTEIFDKASGTVEKVEDKKDAELEEFINEEKIEKSHSIRSVNDDGGEIEKSETLEQTIVQTSSMFQTHEESIREIVSKDFGASDVEKEDDKMKRTSSSDSKSSASSAKSPEDIFSTCSSSRKMDSETCPDVVLRKPKVDSESTPLKPDRKSGVDLESYSSSGESYYHSFEVDSKSRPCSSDIEGIVPTASSEYESALNSQELSARSQLTSGEYHTAVSSLSSKESMASFESESSGNLASIEASEVSETLVPTNSDLEGDMDIIDQQILGDTELLWPTNAEEIEDLETNTTDLFNELEKESASDSDRFVDIPSKMKRSYEMTFQPEPKVLSVDSPHTESNDLEEKFGTSLDDGSVLSVSLSSTSSIQLKTVIELSKTESGGLEESLTTSALSDHMSLEDVDSMLRSTENIAQSHTSTSTVPPTQEPVESVTILSASFTDNGKFNVCSQVTTETAQTSREIQKVSHDELKKKGHRRQESNSFIPSLIHSISKSPETQLPSEENQMLPDYEKIEERTIESSIRHESQDKAHDLSARRQSGERRDSHGKSSTTSSEKSSFEEAEAEAAFNMVAHISPVHKIKQICPIIEDIDAEKNELEAKELAERERIARANLLKDASPGSIPDIKVTEHMAPLDETGFRYPELEMERIEQKQDQEEPKGPESETPVSISSKSSEDTDQGREYTLEERNITHKEETYEERAFTESKSEITTVVEKTMSEEERATDSPNSDSFELVEKPDIIDDFVVIEEVGKEACEMDSEGKSVTIQGKPKRIKKHDEEIDAYLAKSDPTPLTKMTELKYFPNDSNEDLEFDFEDSPPQKQKGSERSKDYGLEYDRELEANRKWIEQQFHGDQAAMAAAGYGYEMEFERGPLEDIKEEDINDIDLASSRIGSLGSQKESGGSLGSIKDSYSSTPEYDVLAGRKYFTKSGEHDDISMSSLQEFENLERAMSLETKKFHHGSGSQDSSSNGSFKTRYYASKGQGDDISVSSLKEFEGLEKACIAAYKTEIKVKEEEEMLSQIEEAQESLPHETQIQNEIVVDDKKNQETDEEDYEKRMFEIDEIIRQAQNNVERFIDLKEADKTESLGRGDSVEEVSKVPDLDLDAPVSKKSVVKWNEDDPMVTSTDSLDCKQEKPSHHNSTDSLDQKSYVHDIMTASTDSIEFNNQVSKSNITTDSMDVKGEGSHMVLSDSLELAVASSTKVQTDSLDEDDQRISCDPNSSDTGKDFSSSVKDDGGEHDEQLHELMLGSTDSLEPTSSAATHATYQYETDSVFSGSFTSGGSNTMVSSTDTIDPTFSKGTVDIATAVRKVWFDEETSASGRNITAEYFEDTTMPYVTEVIEPCDDPGFSHTIHRRVELPPEVNRVTFHGKDAEQQLQQFIDNFGDSEEVHETEEIDADGNVHIKKVVQKRYIIKSSEEGAPGFKSGEHTFTRMVTNQDGNKTTYSQQFEVSPSQLTALTKSLTGDASPKPSGSRDTMKVQATRRRPLRYDISVDDQTEVDPREHDWRFDLNKDDQSQESTTDRQDGQTRQAPVDQHQLSEEMKELLKEMEQASKK